MGRVAVVIPVLAVVVCGFSGDHRGHELFAFSGDGCGHQLVVVFESDSSDFGSGHGSHQY